MLRCDVAVGPIFNTLIAFSSFAIFSLLQALAAGGFCKRDRAMIREIALRVPSTALRAVTARTVIKRRNDDADTTRVSSPNIQTGSPRVASP